MLTRPVYTGVEDIMDFYDTANREGIYTYSVWFSLRDIAFQWHKPDQEAGRQYLEDNLMALAQNGSKDLYYIKFHPGDLKEPYITKKTPIISNTPVRINSLEDGDIIESVPRYSGVPTQGGNYQMMKAIATLENMPAQLEGVINQKMNGVEERLKALEQAPPVEAEVNWMGQISGLLQNEQIMGAVVGLISKLIPQQVLPPLQQQQIGMVEQNATHPPQQVQVPVIDHVIDNDKLEKALDRLNTIIVIDDDLTLMADFADKNPAIFNMFLQQLRNQ